MPRLSRCSFKVAPRQFRGFGPYGGKRLIFTPTKLATFTAEEVCEILGAELGDPSALEPFRFNSRYFARLQRNPLMTQRAEHVVAERSVVLTPALGLDLGGPSQFRRALEKLVGHRQALLTRARAKRHPI